MDSPQAAGPARPATAARSTATCAPPTGRTVDVGRRCCPFGRRPRLKAKTQFNLDCEKCFLEDPKDNKLNIKIYTIFVKSFYIFLSIYQNIVWIHLSLFTCDAGVDLQKRVQQHTLVELTHVVIFISSAPVEAPGTATASFAQRPATSRTRAPRGAVARGEHLRFGWLADRQFVLGELVLARRFRRAAGRTVVMTVRMMMVMQTITGVQLALFVRFRMVSFDQTKQHQNLLTDSRNG